MPQAGGDLHCARRGLDKTIAVAIPPWRSECSGDPARPGPAGPQVCKASAAAHDPGEHLSGIESLRLC